ncbi:hypothetical protein NDU88_004877 [Pleurodeles waltl]|uniref:MHC class I antigen n=1 Tax=Pleurodeles waltl TaxID=8319 RepID=A0AAV7M7K8_PLEWA|nr:hypothetical protein NDU88_004877 [Pleurodeles waltl]
MALLGPPVLGRPRDRMCSSGFRSPGTCKNGKPAFLRRSWDYGDWDGSEANAVQGETLDWYGSSSQDYREIAQDYIRYARPDTGGCEDGPVTEDRPGKRNEAVERW